MKRLLRAAGILGFIFLAMSSSPHAQDPRDPGSPYGVLAFLLWDHDWNGYHYNNPDDVIRAADLMQAAGIRMVRMDFLWADIEPEEGHFDFQKYDRIVKLLRERGMGILGILEYNPAWGGVPFNTAPDQARYILYARQVVRHFKEDVMYWEIWNEPDHPDYWQPQDDMTAYSALLAAAAPAIKQEDPTARVVMGGLSKDFPFKLRRIYQKAGRGSFDIVNLHPFVDPLKRNRGATVRGIVKSVQKVMLEFGDAGKPIWFTEMGCPGVSAPNAENTWWCGKSPTEAQQAAWVTALYTKRVKFPGVERIFWAFFRDTGRHFGNGVDSFGLVREDFSLKPAYHAYADVAGGAASIGHNRSKSTVLK